VLFIDLFEAELLRAGLLLTLPAVLLRESPPTLPLPVEFVAGGEGNPEERFEAAPGLGGSGRSGMLGGLLVVVFMLEEEPEPRKIADSGRLLFPYARRVVLI
jgi:hypothetical protein